MIINDPIFILVTGDPTTGKSTFSTEFQKHNLNTSIVTIDSIIVDDMSNDAPKEYFKVLNRPEHPHHGKYHLDVRKFSSSDDFDVEKFLNLLEQKIEDNIKYYTNIVLIEGFTAGIFLFRILSLLQKYNAKVIQLKFSEYRNIEYNNSIYNTNNFNYLQIFTNIDNDIKQWGYNEIIPKCKYQTFRPDLNQSSDTFLKFEKSKLKEIAQNKSYLDIGCNTGFFCFEVANISSKRIVGLDAHSESLKLASKLNNSIYKKHNLTFIHSNIFNYNPDQKFDLISCISTYHYFREKQTDFLKQMYNMLEDKGILLLEVEISTNTPEDGIDKLCRGVDKTPCYFPTQEYFEKQMNGLFTIEEQYDSVFQKGSIFNRKFFKLQKCLE